MKIESYNHFGGTFPDIGALKNILAHAGVQAPHTGEPYSEEMLFGIAGGVGVIYFTFVFNHSGSEFRTMYISTRDVRMSSNLGYAQTAAERIGCTTLVQETGGAKAATANLISSLEKGIPAVVWLDYASLPYSGMPAEMIKFTEHIAVVFGLEDGKAYIGDRAMSPLVITEQELASARGAITSQKRRLLTIEPPQGEPDLKAAILAGISDCARGMTEPSISNFGLKGLEKWADRLTNAKDKQGWPRIFPPGPYLIEALQSVYNYIEVYGTGGAGSRGLYADFLDEASGIVDRPELRAVADEYRHNAELWQKLAESALPDEIAGLRESKELLKKRDRLFVEQGDASTAERSEITRRLDEIKAEMESNFPMSQGEVEDLLAGLQAQVTELHAGEKRAVLLLSEAVADYIGTAQVA